MKTALHATRLRSAWRPFNLSPRLALSCVGSKIARTPMSPAISAAQEATPIVGVIDSGFWPENPSFAALSEPRPDADTIGAKWAGECVAGDGGFLRHGF